MSLIVFRILFFCLVPTGIFILVKTIGIQVRESKPIYYLLASIPLFTLSIFCIIGGLVAGFMAPDILADVGIKTTALLTMSKFDWLTQN